MSEKQDGTTPHDNPISVEAVNALALEKIGMYLIEESPQKAIPILERSIILRIQKRVLSSKVERCIIDLASAYNSMGEINLAIESFGSILNLVEQNQPESYERALVAICLAKFNSSMGNFEHSDRIRRLALQYIYKYNILAPDKYAYCHIMSSEILQNFGMFDEAISDLQLLIEFIRTDCPHMHNWLAYAQKSLGNLYFHRGDLMEAQEVLGEALETKLLISRADHPEVVEYLENLASVSEARGLFKHALRFSRRALEIDQQESKEPIVETSLYNTGRLLQIMGRPDEAKALLTQSLGMLHFRGNDNIKLVRTKNRLGNSLVQLKDFKAAISCFESALSILNQCEDGDNLDEGILLYGLAEAYLVSGQIEEAFKTAQRSKRLLDDVCGRDRRFFGFCLTIFGKILHKMGELNDARDYLWEATETISQCFSSTHLFISEPLSIHGLVLTNFGRFQEGKIECEEALRISVEALGDDNYITKMHKKNLDTINKLTV